MLNDLSFTENEVDALIWAVEAVDIKLLPLSHKKRISFEKALRTSQNKLLLYSSDFTIGEIRALYYLAILLADDIEGKFDPQDAQELLHLSSYISPLRSAALKLQTLAEANSWVL